MVSNYAASKIEVAKVQKVGACPECRQKEISVGSSVPQVQCTRAEDDQCRHALQPMPSRSSVSTAVDSTSVTAQPAHGTANFNAPASFDTCAKATSNDVVMPAETMHEDDLLPLKRRSEWRCKIPISSHIGHSGNNMWMKTSSSHIRTLNTLCFRLLRLLLGIEIKKS
jgi:hypothetical protein